jgi:hypothetical protein
LYPLVDVNIQTGWRPIYIILTWCWQSGAGYRSWIYIYICVHVRVRVVYAHMLILMHNTNICTDVVAKEWRRRRAHVWVLSRRATEQYTYRAAILQ